MPLKPAGKKLTVIVAVTSVLLCVYMVGEGKPWLQERWSMYQLRFGSQASQRQAGLYLIEHGSVHQIPAILELINNNVDLGKRYESKELFVVLDRLIMQGKVDAVPYLVQGIKHRSFFIREYALIYLLALGGRNALGAIPALIEVLGDPHAELRTHAAIILGEIGPEANAAVPALKSLIEDESESVRLFAKRAIVQIQGEESP